MRGAAALTSGDGPRSLRTGVAVEYSLPYLRSHVRDLRLPAFVNGLTPLVEASFETPVVGGHGLPTTGTINPGVIWAGGHYQFGVEAIVPMSRDSGRSVGAVIQAHFYLDDLFPHSIGKPIW